MPLTQDDVEFGCWLSASDHAALTQMARDSGMTQAQVVGALIQMRPMFNTALDTVRRVSSLGRYDVWTDLGGPAESRLSPDGQWVRHSDLTAAIGLNTAREDGR